MSETSFSGVVCILARRENIFSEVGVGVTGVSKTSKNLKIEITRTICELLMYRESARRYRTLHKLTET